MPDDDKGYAAGLGELEDACGALAHLGDAADRRFYGFRTDGLYRVDNHNLGFEFFDLVKDALQRSLGRDIQVLCVACESLGAQLYLSCTLFARGIERLPFTLLHQHLKCEGRFADTGFAAQENQTAGHESAA